MVKYRLPRSLTQVTWFSKILALLLVLGFIGSAFYAGIAFDQQYQMIMRNFPPTPTPLPVAQTICQTDSDCVLTTVTVADSCCPNTKCLTLADPTVIAVNSQWLTSQKKNICKNNVCPMYATMCTRQITEENAHYSAKCVQQACEKVRN